MTHGNVPAWMPLSAGLRTDPNGLILGVQNWFMEHAAALGAEGDICLINPAGYYLCTKAGGGIDFASSIHLYFDQAKTAFRWTARMGGEPLLSAPVSPAKGNATKAHFVTLAAR